MQDLGCAGNTRKRDGAGVEKKAKPQNVQQTLRDSSATILVRDSPLSIGPINETIFGDPLWDGPIGLKPCTDSTDDRVLVWESMQLVLGTSQCSVIVLSFAQALPVKKNNGFDARRCAVFLKKIHIYRGTR